MTRQGTSGCAGSGWTSAPPMARYGRCRQVMRRWRATRRVLGRRYRYHPGPLVGRRGTRGIAGRRQGQAGQAAAGRAVRLPLRPGRQLAAPVHVSQRADPLETFGIIPVGPLPCWGWGDIPDQYGRRWDGDDGRSPCPRPPTGWPTSRQSCPGGTPAGTRPAALPADGSAIRYRDLIT